MWTAIEFLVLVGYVAYSAYMPVNFDAVLKIQQSLEVGLMNVAIMIICNYIPFIGWIVELPALFIVNQMVRVTQMQEDCYKMAQWKADKTEELMNRKPKFID